MIPGTPFFDVEQLKTLVLYGVGIFCALMLILLAILATFTRHE